MTNVTFEMSGVTVTVSEVTCPRCRAPEVNPETDLLWIRGFKVDPGDGTGWNSHCLRCHCWFDEGQTRVTEVCSLDCRCYKSYPPYEGVTHDH